MSRLDEWLGRADLKTRIEELEDELDRQRERYEAESERRSTAVRERQQAEERVNRLEDRIAQLDGELDRVRGGEDSLEARHRERLRGRRAASVVDRLRSIRSAPESVLTATVDGSRMPDAVEDTLGERARLAVDVAPCLVCVDDANVVSVALSGPCTPTVEPTWSDRPPLEPAWFLPEGNFALALVRSDLFAMGRYEGRDRLDYVGFESDVKGAHSKGGFSQARFARIRDGQIDDHVEQATAAIEEGRHAEEPLYLVGQREIVDELASELDPAPAAVDVVDATGKPEPALADAFRSFWTTELLVL